MDPVAFLLASSIVIALLSVITASYKTGFVAYSMPSYTRSNQPKFEVDKSKITSFAGAVAGAFLANVMYGFVVLRDLNEIGAILLLSLVNTAFISYSFIYWILLKEKPKKSKS